MALRYKYISELWNVRTSVDRQRHESHGANSAVLGLEVGGALMINLYDLCISISTVDDL